VGPILCQIDFLAQNKLQRIKLDTLKE